MWLSTKHKTKVSFLLLSFNLISTKLWTRISDYFYIFSFSLNLSIFIIYNRIDIDSFYFSIKYFSIYEIWKISVMCVCVCVYIYIYIYMQQFSYLLLHSYLCVYYLHKIIVLINKSDVLKHKNFVLLPKLSKRHEINYSLFNLYDLL